MYGGAPGVYGGVPGGRPTGPYNYQQHQQHLPPQHQQQQLQHLQHAQHGQPQQRFHLPVNGPFDAWVDEKEKIIRDIYSKTITDPRTGQLVLDVKYVYHMKIKEYSSYPQLMPPSNLTPAQLGGVKDRILCICAKLLGRVLIQKGKYNDHKYVYQIGRTWDIDELKEIVQCGSDGFILVLNKNYYWKSSEGQDRLGLFVKNLARTYGSYTGKYPAITGFENADLALPNVPMKNAMNHQPNNNEIVGLGLSSAAALGMDHPGITVPKPVIGADSMVAPSYSSASSSLQQSPNPNQLDKTKQQKRHELDYRHQVASQKQPTPGQHPYSNLVTGAITQESLASEDNFNFGSLVDPPNRSVSQATTVIHRRKESELSHASSSTAPLSKPFDQLADTEPGVNFIGEAQTENENEIEIEEISDHSSVDWNSPKVPPVKNADLSPIDSSIQEIEAYMDRQLSKTFRNDMVPVPEIKIEEEEHPALNIKKRDAIDNNNKQYLNNIDTHSDSLTFGEDDAPSMISDDGNDDYAESSEEKLEKDPEIEEILEELKWDIVEGSELLVKKLRKKLNVVKLTNAKNLVNFDFGKESVFDDIDFSVREVNNLSHIFTKLSIDVRSISSKVAYIENESDGLQMKTINEAMLLNELQSIVDDLNIDDYDLGLISKFSDYENLESVNGLETKLVRLYAALYTIRDTDTGGLNKMLAIKQYQETYEAVASRFSENFLMYFKSSILRFMNGIIPNVSKIGPTVLFQDINRWTTFSGLLLFVKDISNDQFVNLRESFNESASELVNEWLKYRLEDYHKVKVAEANAKEAEDVTSKLNPPESPDGSLVRKGGLRLSTRKERLISRLSGINVGDSKYEVERTVFLLIFDTMALVQSFAYILTTLFHYPMDGVIFPKYVEENSFSERVRLSQVHTFTEIDKVYRQCTSDLVNNMMAIFGNYVIQFSKVVIPSETFVLKVVRALEKATNENIGNAMQDFLIFNFIKKLKDKYINLWNRHVQAQIDQVNQSTIGSKIHVLSCLRRIIGVVQILEAQALMKAPPTSTSSTTTPTILNSSGSIGAFGESTTDTDDGFDNGTLMAKVAESSYGDITLSLTHLFEREDPLLKNSDFDDQERSLRNVSIILNTFYLTDQLQIGNKELSKLIGTVSKYYEQSKTIFFNDLMAKSIGKLVEFVRIHSQVNQVKYNKKAVKQALSGYDIHSLSSKVVETHRKMEALLPTSESGVERILLEKLWNEYEVSFSDIIAKTNAIVRREYPDVEFNIPRVDVRSMFKSATIRTDFN